MKISDRPDGRESVTVAIPLVGPAAAVFATVIVKVAFDSPWKKFPECDLTTVNRGGAITVESLTLLVDDPPPETLA
jgi:hypothetical protein